MKTFCVYLLGRDQPVEVKADWFALATDKGEHAYRFVVETHAGNDVIGETPARNVLLIVESKGQQLQQRTRVRAPKRDLLTAMPLIATNGDGYGRSSSAELTAAAGCG